MQNPSTLGLARNPHSMDPLFLSLKTKCFHIHASHVEDVTSGQFGNMPLPTRA